MDKIHRPGFVLQCDIVSITIVCKSKAADVRPGPGLGEPGAGVMMTLRSLDRTQESAGHKRPSQNEPENTVKDNEKDMQQKQQSCDESL